MPGGQAGEASYLHHTVSVQILSLINFREWKKELVKAEATKSITQKSYSPSLAKAMIRTFGPFYAFLGIFTFIEECILRIFQPLFMGKLALIYHCGKNDLIFIIL